VAVTEVVRETRANGPADLFIFMKIDGYVDWKSVIFCEYILFGLLLYQDS